MKVYLSSALIDLERLEDLVRAGFDGWEVIAEGRQSLDEEMISLIEYATSSYDLEISVHAPFSDLNIASLNEPIWEESLRQISAAIEGLASYARVFVIHPGYVSPLAVLCPNKALDKNQQALARLAICAKEYDARATVENMANIDFLLGRFPDEIEEMFVDNLGFTLDVGHAQTVRAVRSFLQMPIDHVHLHDNNGKTDDHMVLGSGSINWERIMRDFKRYKGIFVLECRTFDEGVKSLAYLRSITD
jgi:sugar phosphate isomerase/epimerase